MVANSRSTSARASELVGSSITIARASKASARAISTSWRAPGPSASTRVPGERSPRPSSASAAATRGRMRARCRSPSACCSRPSITLSRIERCGASVSSWWMVATPSASASAGPRGANGLPPPRACPHRARSRPRARCSRVLLPAPFSPRSACTSPARTSRSTPASAVTPPNRLTTPRSARSGAPGGRSLISASVRRRGGAPRRSRSGRGSRASRPRSRCRCAFRPACRRARRLPP